MSALLDRTPGARGAIFCDWEGEFVELMLRDHELSDYDLKVIGATVCAAWTNLRSESGSRGAGQPVEMKIRCSQGTILCHGLPEGYYLVLLLREGQPVGASGYALAQAAVDFAKELV